MTKISAADPSAIIQVTVPLLIEVNLQHLFHKILLVCTPRETRIERLVVRDGISEEEAGRIPDARPPIDEKQGYADFIIKNEENLEKSKKQIEELWETLKRIQSRRHAG